MFSFLEIHVFLSSLPGVWPQQGGGENIFFFQSNPANTYFESNKYNLNARRKTKIVIKDLVICGLTIDTYSWIIYFFTFLPSKKDIPWKHFFSSFPSWLKAALQGCLQVESLWLQRWLILGVHASLSRGPCTSQLQAETDGHTQGLPFFLLLLLASSVGSGF